MSTDHKDDETLVKEWLTAEAALYDAHMRDRSARHEATAAVNALGEARKVEAAAWKALAEHRERVVAGRA